MLNKKQFLIFALVVCLVAFVTSGLIFADRVFGVAVKSNMDMYYGKIVNLGAPTNSSDATTKSYVDSASAGGGLWTSYGSYIYPTSGTETHVNYFRTNNNVDLVYNGGNVAVGPRGCTAPNCSSSADGNLSVSGRVNIAQGLTALGTVSLGTSYGFDVYVKGDLYAYKNLSVSGSKNFVINHPLDPENKQLVHSTLEGPEVGVYYRGEGQLQNGKAEVVLPSYFEALTRKDGRTVLLTPKFDNNEPISNLAASAVENGKFQARAIDQNNPSQKFYWEVKAVRSDIAPLEVERFKVEAEKK